MFDVLRTKFEWDENKNQINRRKHGISFEDAVEVFSDPFAVTEQDRIENGEERWRTVGLIHNGTLLVLVAHTVKYEDVEVIRIISARKLDKKERRHYEFG